MTDTEPASSAETSAGTRERILDVALERFARQGYAATSLREIAAELGVSKAALYYHFQSKQDILMGLHVRVHRLIMHRPIPAADDMTSQAWTQFVDGLIATAVANRQLLALHFREQEAIGALHQSPAIERHGQQAEGIEEAVLELLGKPGADAETRIRRIAAIGVVLAAVFGSAVLTGVTDEELQRVLSRVAGEVLRGPD